MKPKHAVFAVIFAGLVYAGTALYRQFSLLKQTCVKFVGYSFQNFSFSNATLVVTLAIKNTSSIGLVIKSTNLKAYINDVFVSNINTNENTLIAANSTNSINLLINFNPASVVSTSVTEFFKTQDALKITVQGSLSVLSSYVLISNIKVDESMTLADILKPSDDKC